MSGVIDEAEEPSERALTLFERFTALTEEVSRYVVALDERQWETLCPEEGRTVGVVLHHAASVLGLIGEAVQAVAEGTPVPADVAHRTMEDGTRLNAAHAEEHADCTPAEVLALLQADGPRLADFVVGLTDAQLDHRGVAWDGEASAEQFIRGALIGHLRRHYQTVRATVESLGPLDR